MRLKTIKFIAAILVTASFFSACNAPQKSVEKAFKGTKIEKQESQNISDVHLRDKKLLYENQDPTEVVTMYLTVLSGNSGENTNHTWEEINTYSVYDYDRMGVDRYKVEGLLQVGDENGVHAGELGYNQSSPNCTVQIRGQSSSQNEQKNYKIRLKDNKGTWRGQSTIALNKHQTEGLRFRNKMAFDLIAGVDQMMGLRTTFIHLYVKDTTQGGNGVFTDYGIYTQVEQLNKTALKAHGLDRNGQLYKINFFEFYRYEDAIKLKDDPTYDLKAFEELLEVKGSDDHQKLITMLEELNDYSVPIETVLKKHFDIENLSYWMAFHILMGNTDTQSRNFYLYSPLNSQKWYFLNWDTDASLKKHENVLLDRTDQIEWETGVSNYWGNILFQRSLKSDVFRKAVDNAVEDLKKYLSAERINTMADTYSQVIKPYLYKMPDRMYAVLTESQYEYIKGNIAGEIETNYQLYKESFNKPMPFYINVPEKTSDAISYSWETAYDFDAENITYTFELATDYGFNNILMKSEGLILPAIKGSTLPTGQYFIRVRAYNQSGYSQTAFDYYIADIDKIYGTKCFYVDAGGNIVEDVYVEG